MSLPISHTPTESVSLWTKSVFLDGGPMSAEISFVVYHKPGDLDLAKRGH